MFLTFFIYFTILGRSLSTAPLLFWAVFSANLQFSRKFVFPLRRPATLLWTGLSTKKEWPPAGGRQGKENTAPLGGALGAMRGTERDLHATGQTRRPPFSQQGFTCQPPVQHLGRFAAGREELEFIGGARKRSLSPT